MYSGISSRMYDVVYRKLGYADKVLREDNLLLTMSTITSMFDYYSFLFDITISDTVFSSLIALLNLGIPLSEIGSIFDFKIELPTPDEFVRGLLIKVEKVDLLEKYPQTASVNESAKGVLSDEAHENWSKTRLEKGVYGKSRYGYAYYDPPAVREFLRSTALALSKKPAVDPTLINRVKSTAQALEIRDELVEDLFNRMQMISYSKKWCTLDYSYIDDCTLPYEDESGPWIEFTNYNNETSSTNTPDLVEDASVCVFDMSYIDMCYAGGSPEVIREENNLITAIRDELVKNARSRLITTPLMAMNYQRTDELRNPRRSIRMEQIGLAHFRNEVLRDLVYRLLSGDVSDPYTLNMYYVATQDLVGKTTRPRGWGDEAFRAMSRDELLEAWVSRWTSQGLRRDLLERIFTLIYDTGILKNLENTRRYEREVVKLSRGVREF